MASLLSWDECVNEVEKIQDLVNKKRFGEDTEKHIQYIVSKPVEEEETDVVNGYLSWARDNQHLKVISADIPSGILPEGNEGTLHDVRVFTRFGPDDAVYDNNKSIRDKVARGNTFLTLTKPANTSRCVLQAMKKFTGGLGDDDDRDSGDSFIWKKYFTKDLDETDFIIATSKANGEAAHLSCIDIDGQLILCGGSKNVHLLFRNKDDIKKYVEQRYRVATEVCNSVIDFLNSLSEKNKKRLLSFLVLSRYTAVFEILSPMHQHVVNLSHLERPVLKFITWTQSDLQPSSSTKHLNIIPPHIGITIAEVLGLETVKFDKLSMTELDAHVKKLRSSFDLEGEVLYFIDTHGLVIGLLKKKTVWYIMLRAIREKIKTAANRSATKPDVFSMSQSLNQLEKRMMDIQKWLSLSPEITKLWTELGSEGMKWTLDQVDNRRLTLDEVRDMFPDYWKRFLEASGNTDRISLKETSGPTGT